MSASEKGRLSRKLEPSSNWSYMGINWACGAWKFNIKYTLGRIAPDKGNLPDTTNIKRTRGWLRREEQKAWQIAKHTQVQERQLREKPFANRNINNFKAKVIGWVLPKGDFSNKSLFTQKLELTPFLICLLESNFVLAGAAILFFPQ